MPTVIVTKLPFGPAGLQTTKTLTQAFAGTDPSSSTTFEAGFGVVPFDATIDLAYAVSDGGLASEATNFWTITVLDQGDTVKATFSNESNAWTAQTTESGTINSASVSAGDALKIAGTAENSSAADLSGDELSITLVLRPRGTD